MQRVVQGIRLLIVKDADSVGASGKSFLVAKRIAGHGRHKSS